MTKGNQYSSELSCMIPCVEFMSITRTQESTWKASRLVEAVTHMSKVEHGQADGCSTPFASRS